MQLKKLDQQFYRDHSHLKQALDNIDGSWIEGKTRGYGVVLININSLTFAIPLRSNIVHRAAYFTAGSNNPNSQSKGLDYSKALLISDPKYISNELFKVNAQQHNRLKDKEHFIARRFEKYVDKYIKAVRADNGSV